MMKKLLMVLLLAASAVGAETTIISMNRDVSETSYTYCSASPFRPIAQGSLADISASTTVTGTSGPFTGMAVGDILQFQSQGTVQVRTVATWTNANSITVNAAITITGASTALRWSEVNCGTTATDGWFSVAQCAHMTLQVDLDTVNAASIDLQVEGMVAYPGAEAMTLLNPTYTAATDESIEIVEGALDRVRVGQKLTTDGGAQSLTLVLSCRENK